MNCSDSDQTDFAKTGNSPRLLMADKAIIIRTRERSSRKDDHPHSKAPEAASAGNLSSNSSLKQLQHRSNYLWFVLVVVVCLIKLQFQYGAVFLSYNNHYEDDENHDDDSVTTESEMEDAQERMSTLLEKAKDDTNNDENQRSLYWFEIRLPDKSIYSPVGKTFPLPIPEHKIERFPSEEERIALYMGSWYQPPCNDESRYEYNHQFDKVVPGTPRPGTEVRWPTVQVLDAVTNQTVMVESKVFPDTTFLLDPTLTLDCASYKLQYERVKYSDRIHNPASNYLRCIDALNLLSGTEQEEELPPILIRFGDSLHAEHLPVISKVRPAFTNPRLFLKKMTAAPACVDSLIRPSVPAYRLHPSSQSVGPMLWKLETNRHFRALRIVHKEDTIPYEAKLDQAIWLGALTGQPMEFHSNDTMRTCRRNQRCNFVLQHWNSTRIHAGLTDTLNKFQDDDDKGSFISKLTKPKQSRTEMLQYKILISMEGNDVASGLKWNLLSHSAVLLSYPVTVTSWAMEEWLEPWVHFVPMLPDGSNAEDMVEWILSHPTESQQIAQRGRQFMLDLMESDGKENRNEFGRTDVEKAILHRYRQLWRTK